MNTEERNKIDGDLSVGHDLAVGGEAIVQGNTHLKGNVRIDGWLDADKMKSVNKGVFLTVEQLKLAYPFPRKGWWAIVGASLPGDIYVENNGNWEFTGQQGGNPNLQLNGIGDRNGIAPLDSNAFVPEEHIPYSVYDVVLFEKFVSLVALNTTSVTYKSTDPNCSVVFDIERKRFLLNVITDGVNGFYYNNWRDADKFGTFTTDGIMPYTKKLYVNKQAERLLLWNGVKFVNVGENVVREMQGQPYGVAPLDEHKIIPSDNIPYEVFNIVTFERQEDDITFTFDTSELTSTSENCSVIFDAQRKVFLLKVTSETEIKYFNDWADSAKFGAKQSSLVIPFRHKFYFDLSDNKFYLWNGEQLVWYCDEVSVALQRHISAYEIAISKIKSQIKGLGVLNFNSFIEARTDRFDFLQVLNILGGIEGFEDIIYPGLIITYMPVESEKWQSMQYIGINDWHDKESWEPFGV